MIKHHVGIIGGSGLYAMLDFDASREEQVRTPFGDPSGPVTLGELGSTRFYFLPRHGPFHQLAPHRVNYRANVYALKLLGARQIVSVSAVGSLQEHIRPGDLVLPDQFIDRSHSRATTFFEDDSIVAHVSLADPTDAALSACLGEAAGRCGVQVHHSGTYVCIEGPQFSTRAESRFFRQMGADVVGMTNLPEARLSREAELPYASCCLVTDYDSWRANEGAVRVDEVVAILQQNSQVARDMLRRIDAWPDPEQSPASSALRDSFISDRRYASSHARERLALLIGKYFSVEPV